MQSNEELTIKKNSSRSVIHTTPHHPLEQPTAHSHPQLYISNKFISHHPKAGINPLTDAAAYLFSMIGKLKQLKSHRNLNQLQKELIEEINHFQELAKNHGYSSDFILAGRYALCATLDDIITSQPWGAEGQWEPYRLQLIFNTESPNYERFFLILERIVKDPCIYIHLMEFMYICLSLGFKGDYRAADYNNNELDQITDALYKHIRAYQGNYNKTLAPFPLRIPSSIKAKSKHFSLPNILLFTAGIILTIFIGLSALLNSASNQANQELTHIGKSLLYETPESSQRA